MTAGAVEGLIKTSDEWAAWLKDNPGARYSNQRDLAPPFYVISRAVNPEGEPRDFMHHLISVADAHEIIAAERGKRSFIDTQAKFAGFIIQRLESYFDQRGHLTELFRRDELQRLQRTHNVRVDFPAMAYLSITNPGVSRGPHEHLTQTDMFVFCQSMFEIYLWDNRPKSKTFWMRTKITTVHDGYVRVFVPPGVVHAYKAIGDKPGLVVNCPDKLYAGWNEEQPVDEIRHEKDPTSPFRIW